MSLPQNILDKASQAGIKTIELNFDGSYLSAVNLFPWQDDAEELENEIAEWAKEEFPGCDDDEGESFEEGRDVTYDLENKVITCAEWCMEKTVHNTSTETW